MSSTPKLLRNGEGAASEPDFPGTERFVIRRRLGAGGMGVVYEAFDRERAMAVALKTLRHADAIGIYRFKTEFRALADLEHRNLVRLGELFHEGNAWFFSMELVPGVHFLHWVHGPGQTPEIVHDDTVDIKLAAEHARAAGGAPPAYDEARLRDALAQLVLGVSALHRAGKVHRDIKPNNVMVTPKGRVVLLDLGLVAEIKGGVASDPNVVGTAAYMAPEQAGSPVLSPAADWYSVGVMLFEALTGRLPFTGAPLDVLMRKQRELPPRPSQFNREVPVALDDLCIELLAGDPNARPRADAILARLGSGTSADPELRPSNAAQPFVGRESELAALHAALAEVAATGALTLFIRGESGIGKTALVRRFLDALGEVRLGPLALSARCYERESVPFKAVDGLIDALARHLSRRDTLEVALMLPPDIGALARVFPVLLRVPAIARTAPVKVKSPFELRKRAFAALRELLVRLSADQPIVVHIDDYQWADADSHALLDEVLDPPGAPRLLLLATRRAVADSLFELRPLPGVFRELELTGLSPAEGRKLVELLAGPAGTDGPARSIADDADGHPLFIQELVRHDRAAGAAAPGTLRLDEALQARVDRLEDAARRVLEATAVAAGPVAQSALAHAAELEPASCAKWVGQLRAAMLVRTRGVRGGDLVECYHDRVREAVLSCMTRERRRRIHGLLADAIEAAGGAHKDALTLVRHLEAAGATARAALVARHAATQAMEALAFDQAADLYATALRLGAAEPEDRRVLARQRAEALAHAGRGPEAATAYLEAAAATSNADERFNCRRSAAEQFLISGYLERGLATLRTVLADAGVAMPASRAESVRSLLWHWAVLRVRGVRWKPRATADVPARELMRFEVYRTVSLGLAMVDSVLGADFQARATLLAMRIGDPQRVAHALGFNALYLASRGGRRLARAQALAAEGQRLQLDVGDPWLEAWLLSCRGVIQYFAGHYREAAQLLAEAESEFRDQTVSTTSELAHVRVFQLLALRRLCAFRELGESYRDYVRDAGRRGDRYAETTLIRAANVIWLAEDDPRRARHELARTTWTPPDGGYHLQHWFELRARVDIALYQGEPVDAWITAGLAAFPRTQFARMQVLRAENEWMCGRVALLAGDLAAAARSARRLRGEGIDYARAWGLLLEAAVAFGRGDRLRASETLHRVVAVAEHEMQAVAVVAGRRAAELAEDPAAIARADAWLAEQGIRRPEAIAGMLAPGFTRRSP